MKVLLVEDDVVQSDIMAAILEADDWVVECANNGYEGLRKIQSKNYDVVLTDYSMPHMNGVEFVKEIQNSGYKIPVVMLTSSDSLNIAFEALKTGVIDFITKTVNGSHLDIVSPVLKKSVDIFRFKKKAENLAYQLSYEKNITYNALNEMEKAVAILDGLMCVVFINNAFKRVLPHLLHEADVFGWLLKTYKMEKTIGVNELFEFIEQSEVKEIECNGLFYELKVQKLVEGYLVSLKDVTVQQNVIQEYKDMIDLSNIFHFIVDINYKISFANKSVVEFLEVTKNTILGTSIYKLLQAEAGNVKKVLQVAKELEVPVELNLLHPIEDLVPVEVSVVSMPRQKNKILISLINIQRQKDAESRLKESLNQVHMILKSTTISMVATDLEGQIISVSPALEKLVWYKDEELVHQKNITYLIDPGELIIKAEKINMKTGKQLRPGLEVLVSEDVSSHGEAEEWTYVRKDRSKVSVNLSVTKLYDNENVKGYLFNAIDITEEKKARSYIEHIAHHDFLTGLPNRSLMNDRLINALASARRYKYLVAVIVLDLDHFKRINDTLGHLAGDELIKNIADILSGAVRETDTVCRMGGDEFVVILTNIESESSVINVCEKVQSKIKKPINIGMSQLHVTCSMGYAIAMEDGLTPEELLKHADIAMYASKERGRNNFTRYDIAQVQESLDKLQIEQDLHLAFNDKNLKVFYQPQIDINSKTIVGFEALLRWEHPDRGVISPTEFIPMTETTGFIVPLGAWVLEQACKDILQVNKIFEANYRVAVNVSPRQFEHADFLDMVITVLQKTGLSPSLLELEITEGMFVKDTKMVYEKLMKLHEMGVHIAIDDFGTGYSNLAYVSKYPINTIKIDRHFLDVKEKSNVAIVSAISAIGEGLDLCVLAEGVETLEQLDFVTEKDCHIIQGYLYSMPLPYENIVEYVEAGV